MRTLTVLFVSSLAAATSAQPAAPAPPAAEGKFDVNLQGQIRLGGSIVQADPRAPFVGQSDGFQLLNARVLLSGTYAGRLRFELSVDGAQDPRGEPEKGVLRRLFDLEDAYAEVRFWDALYLRFGQAKVPFSAEDLWPTARLKFVHRSIVSDGLRPGEWRVPDDGLGMDRELGLAAGGRTALGSLLLEYEAAAINGNGANQAQNDNAKIAGVGRLELTVPAGPARVEIGASGLYNPASTGVLPNRFEQRRIGYGGDITVRWEGLQLFGMILGRRSTNLETTAQAFSALGVVAQVAYEFERLGLEPAYRFATYDPDSAFQGDQVMTHSIGLNWYSRGLPLRVLLDYNLRLEEASRAVDNNALEGAVQVVFQ